MKNNIQLTLIIVLFCHICTYVLAKDTGGWLKIYKEVDGFIVKVPSSIEVPIGANFTLTCKFESLSSKGDGNAYVTWLKPTQKDDVVIKLENLQNSSNLIFNNVKPSKKGLYVCASLKLNIFKKLYLKVKAEAHSSNGFRAPIVKRAIVVNNYEDYNLTIRTMMNDMDKAVKNLDEAGIMKYPSSESSTRRSHNNVINMDFGSNRNRHDDEHSVLPNNYAEILKKIEEMNNDLLNKNHLDSNNNFGTSGDYNYEKNMKDFDDIGKGIKHNEYTPPRQPNYYEDIPFYKTKTWEDQQKDALEKWEREIEDNSKRFNGDMNNDQNYNSGSDFNDSYYSPLKPILLVFGVVFVIVLVLVVIQCKRRFSRSSPNNRSNIQRPTNIGRIAAPNPHASSCGHPVCARSNPLNSSGGCRYRNEPIASAPELFDPFVIERPSSDSTFGNITNLDLPPTYSTSTHNSRNNLNDTTDGLGSRIANAAESKNLILPPSYDEAVGHKNDNHASSSNYNHDSGHHYSFGDGDTGGGGGDSGGGRGDSGGGGGDSGGGGGDSGRGGNDD